MNNFKEKNKPLNDLKKPDRNEAGLGYSENDFNDGVYSKNKGNKGLPPKFIFGVLLILGSATLIYGFVSLSGHIYGPQNKFEQANANNQQAESSSLVDDLLELQSRDTDSDGLNDYEEMYVYKTSAYLPDTDSDGYPDKDEIDNGYDPLCPKGQDCRGVEPDDQDDIFQGEEDELFPAPPEDGLPQDVINELGNLTPQQIRELLLESGEMTQEQIDQVDDATLMEIYSEVLGSQ